MDKILTIYNFTVFFFMVLEKKKQLCFIALHLISSWASQLKQQWTKIVFGNIPSPHKTPHNSSKWVWFSFMGTGSGNKIGNCNIMALIQCSYSYKEHLDAILNVMSWHIIDAIRFIILTIGSKCTVCYNRSFTKSLHSVRKSPMSNQVAFLWSDYNHPAIPHIKIHVKGI